MRTYLPVTQKEHLFDNQIRIISTTDIKGRITSVNQDFISICGYTEDELLGKPHNIIRHPDMPAEAFADLWQHLKTGKPWMGLVKNRCKNGDHYWVNAYVTPIYKEETLTGYQSVRTTPEREYVDAAERLYARLKQGKSATSKFKLKHNTKLFLGNLLMIASPLGLVGMLEGLSWNSFAIGGIACVIATALLSYWQHQPWRRLLQRAKKTHDSDLACIAYLGDNATHNQAEIAIQALQSQQATLVELLQNSASHLMSVIQNNNAVMQQNNQGISQQSSEISQLATAINEMSTTIQQVAQNAQETATHTQGASAEADQGKNVITQASDSIAGLVNEVSSASQLVHQLNDDTKNISSIISVIEGIAEQTNLLALNAAIEAARAGESGRGFAVVADEVRTLANRTQTSTSEIEAMINRLQNRVEQTVSMMDVSQTHAEKTVHEAEQVNSTLHNIAATIDSVNDMNTLIATATEQQSAVTEEINRNVTNLHDAAGDINHAAEQSSEAGRELEAIAEEMNSVVRQFRCE